MMTLWLVASRDLALFTRGTVPCRLLCVSMKSSKESSTDRCRGSRFLRFCDYGKGFELLKSLSSHNMGIRTLDAFCRRSWGI